MQRELLWTGCLLLVTACGCTLCASPHDCKYAAYGGLRERADRVHGRVASILDPATELGRDGTATAPMLTPTPATDQPQGLEPSRTRSAEPTPAEPLPAEPLPGEPRALEPSDDEPAEESEIESFPSDELDEKLPDIPEGDLPEMPEFPDSPELPDPNRDIE